MHFVDDAIDRFRAALGRDRLLDDSVLVVFGDHDAGFARDAALAKTIGVGSDEASWMLNDRVPLFIRAGGHAAAADLAGERMQPAGQTDFAPTILSLLGVDATALPYVGRNLLGGAIDSPVPRPYGDWLDDHHLFLARGAASSCIDLARRAASPLRDCADADAVTRRMREVSRLVVVDDLQQRLRDGVGEHGR
jgi:lipoteichoic acid synthase